MSGSDQAIHILSITHPNLTKIKPNRSYALHFKHLLLVYLRYYFIVAVSIALVSSEAFAQPNDLTGTWTINGNGRLEQLILTQGSGNFWAVASPNNLSGTIDGDRVKGYFSPGERTAVLVRYANQTIPSQVFIGSVNPSGTEWSGEFHAFSELFGGASQQTNKFGFNAMLGTSITPPTKMPSQNLPGWDFISPCYGIKNRPKEFGVNNYSQLQTDLGSNENFNNGNLDGFILYPVKFRTHLDKFLGYYSAGSGNIVFLRLSDNGTPLEVYVGQAIGGDSTKRVVGGFYGSYYALNEGMDASFNRMTFDWHAVNTNGCIFGQ